MPNPAPHLTLESAWLDLKFTLRSLRRNPTFTTASIATLAVGLGCMITVLCVVSTLLWKPLPYADPQSLVVLNEVDPRGGQWSFSAPMLLDVEERSTALHSIAGYQFDTLPLTGSGETEAIRSAAVTSSLFNVFGMVPLLGKPLQDSQPQVFLSVSLWKRKWQQDPRIIGSTIVLAGENYTVAGVGNLPDELFPGVELFHPLTPQSAGSRSAHEIEVVGRLRPGVALGQAQAQLNSIASSIGKSHTQTNGGWGLRSGQLDAYLAGPGTKRMIWMIFAAVTLLWILASLNVAGLQIARTIARRNEIGTRLALGASRAKLLSQTMAESLVLATAGGILGAIAAQYALSAIRVFGSPYFSRLSHIQMDFEALLGGVAFLMLSTVISGTLSNQVSAAIHGMQDIGARESGTRTLGRDVLIVVQVALASILLLGATLLFQSFLRLRAVNPGFDPDRILSVRVSLPSTAQDERRRIAFFANANEQIARLPQVESTGASNVLPLTGHGTANRFRVEGEPASEYHVAAWRAITPGFFATLGIPLKQGRFFNQSDVDGALEVVVISESMARRFWPNQNPVGQRLLWGKSRNPKTIVGIAGDLRDLTLDAEPVPTMFRPFPQLSDAPMTLLIRTRNDPSLAIPDIRRQLWALDRNAALECQPLRQVMADSILRPQAASGAVVSFALVALLTAGMGLYGLINYRVNQRQQEIGIRMALGAAPGNIHWSIQKRCLVLVLAGAALGLPAGWACSQVIASLLYQTRPTEISAYAAVVAMFVGVALFASFGPALRAARLDPIAAIRHE